MHIICVCKTFKVHSQKLSPSITSQFKVSLHILMREAEKVASFYFCLGHLVLPLILLMSINLNISVCSPL